MGIIVFVFLALLILLYGALGIGLVVSGLRGIYKEWKRERDRAKRQ